jgi:hypothetical protein
VTSSSFTTIPSSSVATGSFEYYKLYLSMPTLSTFRDTMYATVTFKYTGDSISRELDFDLIVKAPGTKLNVTSGEYKVDNFIPGSFLSADTFYISIISNLTINTTFQLPDTYIGKNLFFFTAQKKIMSFKVYGITDSFKFETVMTTGNPKSFKLDISDIDLYYGYVAVPNPSYFQTSEWWFNILNDPKTKYMRGENLVIYGV